MELVDISKYQSISDRIKRLSNDNHSQPNQPAPTLHISSHLRTQLSPSYASTYKKAQIEQIKASNFHKGQQARPVTQQSQCRTIQQTNTFTDDLATQRQHRINHLLSKHKTSKLFQRNNDQNITSQTQKQKKDFQSKQKLTSQPFDRIKSNLSKVKSENALKINEILQSYNNYKENKQKFISDIQGKNIGSRERIVSKNLKDELERQRQENEYRCHQPSVYVQSTIDNMWNQTCQARQDSAQYDNSSYKMQRKTPKDIMNRVKQLRKRQATQEDEQQVKKPFKIVEQNQKPQEIQQNQQLRQKLKMNLSPRNMRVPGKICKNKDISVAIQKESHF